MKILTLTTLYPNAAAPDHGVFVENRLMALKKFSGVDIRVIAPVPWFPFTSPIFKSYGRAAAAPHFETRRGIDVLHPRFMVAPKIGMTLSAHTLEACFFKHARRLIDSGWDFDVIDAHYLYPDGVAAVRVAQRLGKPVVVTARGSDVSQLPDFQRQRAMIVNATKNADGVIAVANALKEALVKIGAPDCNIEVVRNGVDTDIFKPTEQNDIKASISPKTNWSKTRLILSVGSLIDRKGHDRTISALTHIPNAHLAIIGDGPRKEALKKLAHDTGVADRIDVLGQIPHTELPKYYSAADICILASSREGWPNVLLEAMACGTPVVATPIWGSREVVSSQAAGRLSTDQSPEEIAAAANDLLLNTPKRHETVAFAERHSWRAPAEDLTAIFNRLKKNTRPKSRRPLTLPPESKPKLLMTVDTEEAFDWSEFNSTGHYGTPVQSIDTFQSLCERAGLKPLYFASYPIITDAEWRPFLRSLKDKDAADIGLHFHSWVTPPLGESYSPYTSFQTNLPPATHREKLSTLIEECTAAFGAHPKAHRAGRYGVSNAVLRDLAEQNIRLDFSPAPGLDQSHEGGPDFLYTDTAPLNVTFATGQNVAVFPLTSSRALRGTRIIRHAGNERAYWRRALWSKMTAPIRLTCEGATLADLKALTQAEWKRGRRIFIFSFHSTSLAVGASPYAPDATAVSRMIALIDAYLDFFQNEFGGDFVDLGALERLTLGHS
ncbi:MAG: glycosyltransferase [Pseudomonadota bacterium]